MDSVSIHPLVLMSISDHFTRDAHRTKPPVAIGFGSCGLLFGVQGGLGAEVFTSCDMPLLAGVGGGGPLVDKKFLEQQQSLSKPRGCVPP